MKKNFKGKALTFKYRERKNTIECMWFYDQKEPKYVHLSSGVHVQVGDVDMDAVNRRITKNLRTYMYKLHRELGIETDDYIVNIKAPAKRQKGNKGSFIELELMMPNIHGNEMAAHIPRFKSIIDLFRDECERYKENLSVVT